MMNLLIFIIFVITCFLVVELAIGFFHKDAIFTIAIGAVIGANVYNIGSFPIEIGELTFGIDGVVYCIFLFCLLLMFIDYGKQSMELNLYTAMFSIFFTAMLSFFATFIKTGWSTQIWSTVSYIFSIVATYIAVLLMIKLYESLDKIHCNHYLNFAICMLIGNLVNSIIYFGLTFLITGSLGTNFLYALIGSAITKIICTLLCTLLYFVYEKFWHTER